MDPVTDLRDLRVLIPRTRRAIDGPTASASASVSSTLQDGEITALVADAVSQVILFSRGEIGLILEVTARDENYMAPSAWQTAQERSESQDAVIVSEAALNYYFYRLLTLKTSEHISDEGQTWEYTISANLIRDQLKLLIDERDRALDALLTGDVLEVFESFIQVRDAETSRMIEPYVLGNGGLPTGFDPRFLTMG